MSRRGGRRGKEGGRRGKEGGRRGKEGEEEMRVVMNVFVQDQVVCINGHVRICH